ncbi:MAG TPA: hypothetical protein VL181_11375 [Holophagaceae bacterium]|nr:hypothetical protein [Holophagaceae bacterium]
MAANLRQLLIQRAARLQDRPALTAPGWGTLSCGAWRNRVEGVALGLMAQEPPPESVSSRTGTAWDWALEVAAACAGLRFDPAAPEADAAALGGARFNDDHGRRAYHDRENTLDADTPFDARHTHGDMMLRLQRWNRKLGWDHDMALRVPLSALPTEAARAALWNLLYAGGHAVLMEDGPSAPRGLSRLLTRGSAAPAWNPALFDGFWD